MKQWTGTQRNYEEACASIFSSKVGNDENFLWKAKSTSPFSRWAFFAKEWGIIKVCRQKLKSSSFFALWRRCSLVDILRKKTKRLFYQFFTSPIYQFVSY